MKRSHLSWLGAAACVATAIAIGIPWFIICMATAGRLLMNGPWLVAILLLASAIALILQARRQELHEEELEARGRHADR